MPPALEAEYRARFLRYDGRTAAIITGGLALPSLAPVSNDLRLVGPPTRGLLFALRVAAAATIDVVIQSTRPADYLLPVTFDMFLVVCVWALLPNRFSLQAIGAGTITVGAAAWILAFRDPPLPRPC